MMEQERLQKIERLFDDVHAAWLKERELLEGLDITKAAEESAKGISLFTHAALLLAEAAQIIGRAGGPDDTTMSRFLQIRARASELHQLEQENFRTGIQLTRTFRKPKQEH